MLLGLRFGVDEVGAYPDGDVVAGGGESVVTVGQRKVARRMDGWWGGGGGGGAVGGVLRVAVGGAGQVGMVERVDALSRALGRCGPRTGWCEALRGGGQTLVNDFLAGWLCRYEMTIIS